MIEKWKRELMERCLCTHAEGEAAWLQARKSHMTATKAASAVGLSSYSNPMDVYQAWVNPDYTPDFSRPQKLRMRIGLAAEEYILLDASQDPSRPGQFEAFACDAKLVQHPDFEWAACSPDGFAISKELGRVLLEVKNTNNNVKHQYKTEDGKPCCPPGYRAQVVWNMACTGADCGLLIASFNGDIEYRLIERDEAEIDWLFGEAYKFFQACEAQDEMAVFGLIQDGMRRWDAIKDLYRHATTEGICVVDAELDGTISEYLELDKHLKDTADRHKFLKSLIAEKVAGNRRLETSRYRVSWGQNPGRERFDLDLFRDKNPGVDMSGYYVRSKAYRTGMRISQVKEAK